MMNIGVSRKLDPLGRIIIPKEFRKKYQIKEEDALEIIGTEEGILLKVPQIEIKRIQEDKCNE